MYGMVALIMFPDCLKVNEALRAMKDVVHRFLLASMEHLHLECADCLAALFDSASNLRQKVDGRWLRFGEDIDVVPSHTLLGDEHLLGTVDNKVAALVVRALIQVVQI